MIQLLSASRASDLHALSSGVTHIKHDIGSIDSNLKSSNT